jgi:hypothetical protein
MTFTERVASLTSEQLAPEAALGLTDGPRRLDDRVVVSGPGGAEAGIGSGPSDGGHRAYSQLCYLLY